MKAYILILNDVPTGHAINSAAHAGCAMALRWTGDAAFEEWAATSFRKVTCKVRPGEFETCLATMRPDEYIVLTESALDNRVVCAVFKPRASGDWPVEFADLKLWK